MYDAFRGKRGQEKRTGLPFRRSSQFSRSYDSRARGPVIGKRGRLSGTVESWIVQNLWCVSVQKRARKGKENGSVASKHPGRFEKRNGSGKVTEEGRRDAIATSPTLLK